VGIGIPRCHLSRAPVGRAARLADGIFVSSPVAKFVEQVHWVLDECERIGRDPSTFRFIHYSVLLAGASQAEAQSAS
jgi:alkanesulfonate monooxygenase SsuD/methylene tetrahydromethanopterin reductase-like flavin-dependent oxidoreductase (luciferase family)